MFLLFLPIIFFYLEPSVVMFKRGAQNFTTSDLSYNIPVVRTRNLDSPVTVKWRTKEALRYKQSGTLMFGPGETENNIVIERPVEPETFQLELSDPSSNAMIGERKTTIVNVIDHNVGKTQWGVICCKTYN